MNMKKTLICLFIVFAGFINLYSQKTDKTTKETTIKLSVKKTQIVKTTDVQIVTDPSHAIVEISGYRVGRSPIMLQLENGVPRIVVSKDKYQTVKKKIAISQHGIIKLDLKTETHANVTIHSVVGATIYLNGELLGVTSVQRR